MAVLWDGVPKLSNPSPTAQALTSGGTIPTVGGLARVAPAAAVTTVILQPGTVNGQMVTVVNEAAAANTITFDAAGTSYVADGAGGTIIPGLMGRTYVWSAAAGRWFRTS